MLLVKGKTVYGLDKIMSSIMLRSMVPGRDEDEVLWIHHAKHGIEKKVDT